MTNFANTNVPFGTQYVKIGLQTDFDEMEYFYFSFIDTPKSFGATVQYADQLLTNFTKQNDELSINDINFVLTINEFEYRVTVNKNNTLCEYEIFMESLA